MPSASLSRAGKMLLTTFGLGLMRPASGTWGSMPTVAIAMAAAMDSTMIEARLYFFTR